MITNSVAIRNRRSTLALTDEQKQLIIGTLLGDGSLIVNSWGKHYRLQIEHQVAHEEYVQWKYQKFYDWVLSPPKMLGRTQSVKFRTMSHPELTALHALFYPEHRKVIPLNINELLRSPIALAVWFMDDGAYKSRNTFTISTHCFVKRSEQYQLIQCLKANFGLHASLHNDGKGHRLYIPSQSGKKFKDIIRPYMVDCMRYKIGMTP